MRFKELAIKSVVSLLVFTACDNKTAVIEEPIQPESQYRWDICIDNYDIVDGVIEKNQMLSDILKYSGIKPIHIHEIEKQSESTFSVRKLRVGNNYHLLQTRDSLAKIEYFIYDISPIEYVVYSFCDSIHTFLGTVETDTIIRTISGSIDYSLWSSMIDNNASPELAGMLSDIYSWTIDFFGIQPKDSFCVCFQEIYADSVAVGLGKILASNFITRGVDNYAFYYKYRSDRGEYFDEKGNSLRRAFLKAPLEYKRISSTFSNARVHPVTKIVRAHHGVDYAAPAGTPVYSVGDGVVITKAWDSKGGGNYIKIKHNGTYTTEYMHLRGFAKGLEVGKHVSQGELIGYVGSTGMSTGPHLDFRVFKDGKAINPLSMDLPAVDPIAESDMSAYFSSVKEYMRLVGLDDVSIR